MPNHYHLLLKFGCKDRLSSVSPKNFDCYETPELNGIIFGMTDDSPLSFNETPVSYFVRRLNSLLAKKLNEIDDQKGRKVFYQYWDYCIRGETDFFKIFNYIHQNPIKHDLFRNLEELENFEFCSFKHWMAKEGKDFLFDCFYYYPTNDIKMMND
jgi:hypothetical protein